MTEYDLLMTFNSTHQALRGDKQLKALQIPGDLIPTPRRISAGCGLTLELRSQDLERLLHTFESEKIYWDAIYRRDKEELVQLRMQN